MYLLDCTDVVQFCYNAKKILALVKVFLRFLEWSIPLLLIVLGTFDIIKAVTKGDNADEAKKAVINFVKRAIAGVIIFLVPFLIQSILGLLENNLSSSSDDVKATSWVLCWNNVDKKNTSYFNGCRDIYKKDESDTENGSQNKNQQNGENLKSCYVYFENTCNIGVYSSSSSNYKQPHCEKIIKVTNHSTNSWKNGVLINSDQIYCESTCSESESKLLTVFGKVAENKNSKEYYCVCIFSANKKIVASTSNPRLSGIENYDEYGCIDTSKCTTSSYKSCYAPSKITIK